MLNHKPVLLKEVITGLALKPNGIYVDGTFGRGGHSSAILEQLSPDGRLLAVDKDPQAIAVGMSRFANDPRFRIERGSFASLPTIISNLGWQGRVSGIFLDLGVSSPQLDDPQRGFSFLRDGPLDMRMDPATGLSAAEWLNAAAEKTIADVLFQYGEERFSRRIAKAIVRERQREPFHTTGRLAAVIAEANPAWERDKHPATRCFQAIRIFINNELADLQACLDSALDILAPGGRLLVISFHSLEDRIVKRFMRSQTKADELPLWVPVTRDQFKPKFRLLGKAIKPTEDESIENPRARSAVLRIGEKLL